MSRPTPQLSRREFLAASAGTATRVPAAPRGGSPARLRPGPHLFLDDFLVEREEGLSREVRPPARLPEPVLSSARFGTTQPYLGLLRDPDSRRLRLWYNRGNAIWHTESTDGLHWEEARLAWDLKRCYGVTVIDDRGRDPDPDRRFKLANWQATREKEDRPGDDSGMWVGCSPDGFRWRLLPGNPVLPTWPEGWGKPVHHGAGDIIDAFWDPIHRRYGCAVKVHAVPGDGFPKGPRAGDMFMRRWIGMSASTDFLRWEKPWQIAIAGPHDAGLTEFYGMGGVHARGDLLIGFARLLRDDLPCDPGGPPGALWAGIGWSCLMTSRDGVVWQRSHAPFLDRSPTRGAWDHAMAWLSGAVPVGDELFLYYGGYARGHKVEPARERQIGLARMPRDRYLSRSAGPAEALLLTPPVLLEGDRITVNAAVRGSLRLRLRDAAGRPLEGFTAEALRGDSLAHGVRWPGVLTALRGRPVRLELRLADADLYGFDLA